MVREISVYVDRRYLRAWNRRTGHVQDLPDQRCRVLLRKGGARSEDEHTQ